MSTAHIVECLPAPSLLAPLEDREARVELETLVLRHLPQVRMVARGVAARLPQHVELADLINAGVVGLIEAVKRFDPARDSSLSTFAQFRIRGAILDSLRRQDWGTRELRRAARRIEHARHALAMSFGAHPSDAEVAAHLGTPLAELQDQLRRIRDLEVVNFTDPTDEDAPGVSLDDLPSPTPTPLQAVLRRERTQRLIAAIQGLAPRERQVIKLYYVEERTMKEIGLIMGVGESRVCQVHSAALARLKKTLAVHKQLRQDAGRG